MGGGTLHFYVCLSRRRNSGGGEAEKEEAAQDLMVSGWAEAGPTAPSADRGPKGVRGVHCVRQPEVALRSGPRWTDEWEWGPPGYKWH